MELKERSELAATDAATPQRGIVNHRVAIIADGRISGFSHPFITVSRADMLTLIHTFKLNSVHRQAWLADVFPEIASTRSSSSRALLSSWNWKSCPELGIDHQRSAGPHRGIRRSNTDARSARPRLRSSLDGRVSGSTSSAPLARIGGQPYSPARVNQDSAVFIVGLLSALPMPDRSAIHKVIFPAQPLVAAGR
jgi:hypothetical protein